MDQATYKARVDAFLSDMRLKGVPPEAAAEMLSQLEQTDKTAAEQRIAYKEAATPRGELDALYAAFKSAGVDPDSDIGQQLEDLWVDEGLAVALGQVAQFKAANVPRVIASKVWPHLYTEGQKR